MEGRSQGSVIFLALQKIDVETGWHAAHELGAFFAHGMCAEVGIIKETEKTHANIQRERERHRRRQADKDTRNSRETDFASTCVHASAHPRLAQGCPENYTLALWVTFTVCWLHGSTVSKRLTNAQLICLEPWLSFHFQSELRSWLGTTTVTFGSKERPHTLHPWILCEHVWTAFVFKNPSSAEVLPSWTCIRLRLAGHKAFNDLPRLPASRGPMGPLVAPWSRTDSACRR